MTSSDLPDVFSSSNAVKHLSREPYGRLLALIFLGLFLILLAALIFLPWQQNVVGKGEVTVFSPMDRPQTIHAPLDSKILQWHVSEGDVVQQGDLLVSLGEIKTDYLDPNQRPRLQQERNALLDQQSALQQQLAALGAQLASQRQVQRAAVPSAQLKISQANNKLLASQQKLLAAQQAKKTATFNLSRRQELFNKGLRSKRDLELAELDIAKANAQYQSAQADVEIAGQEKRIAALSTNKITAETDVKQIQVVEKQATLHEKLAKLQQAIVKLDNKISNIEQRGQQRDVRAVASGK